MYQFIIKKKAKKFIDKLPANERKRVVSAIEGLPYIGDIKSLKNNEGLYRLREGDYRIIYEIDNGKMIIYVIDAENRGQIYREY